MLRKLDEFWFVSAHPAGLAILRFVLGAYALHHLTGRYDKLMRVAGTHDDLFQPVGIATLLESPIPVCAFQTVLCLTILANVAFLLGWRFRLTGPLFAGLLLCVLCYSHSWSMIYHSHNLLVLHALILGFSPAADAWSIDALLRSSTKRSGSAQEQAARMEDKRPGWCYGWPVRLICFVTALTYFLAGVAKVAGPLGWSWASGQAVRDQIAVDALRKMLLGHYSPTVAATIYEFTALFFVMGCATLVLELVAPLANLNRKTALAWAICAFGFHWGVYSVMDIKFRYHLCGAVFASFLVQRWCCRMTTNDATDLEPEDADGSFAVPIPSRPQVGVS